jgi:hypothetical protein
MDCIVTCTMRQRSWTRLDSKCYSGTFIRNHNFGISKRWHTRVQPYHFVRGRIKSQDPIPVERPILVCRMCRHVMTII